MGTTILSGLCRLPREETPSCDCCIQYDGKTCTACWLANFESRDLVMTKDLLPAAASRVFKYCTEHRHLLQTAQT